MGYINIMKRYRTMAVVEWYCIRCQQDVVLNEKDKPRCACTTSPSPWEHVRCLNGDGTSEFVLFGRESRQKC